MQQQNFKLNADITALDTVTCDMELQDSDELCGGVSFVQTVIFKNLPAIQSPTGIQTLIPIQAFMCTSCGQITKKFLPEGMNI